MKIICDNCGAKYSIADEKVQGKVFKIRCKKCSEVIVVEGTDSNDVADSADDYSAAYDTGGAAEWYVVLDGERVGPITPEEVEAYFTAGQLHAESYVWKDGLDDWVMLQTLSEFSHITQDAAGPNEETMIADQSGRAVSGSDAHVDSGASHDAIAAADSQAGYDNGQAGYDNGQAGYDNGQAGYDDGQAGYDDGQVGFSDSQPQATGYDEPATAGGSGVEVAGANYDEADSTGVMDPSTFENYEEYIEGDAAGAEPQGQAQVESDAYANVESGTYEDSATAAQNAAGGGMAANAGAGGGAEGYDDGSYDDGYDSDEGGMFAAFDAHDDDGGDYDDGYDEQASASPDLSGAADDLVEARNENSVLFSLSSVDQVEAVNKSSGGADGAGQAQGSDKSGLIDIQSLASTHAAMKGDGSGASTDDDEEFVAGTMNMPALMPSGSHKSNTGLIIGISVVASLLVAGLVGLVVFLLVSDDETPEPEVQPVAVAEDDDEEDGAEEQEQDEAEREAEEAAELARQAAQEEDDEEDEEDEEAEAEEEAEEEETATAQREERPTRRAESSTGGGSRSGSRGGGSSSGSSGSSGSDDSSSGGSGGRGGILGQIDSDDGADEPEAEPEPDLPARLSRSMVTSTTRRYNSQVRDCANNSNPDGITGNAMVRFVVLNSGRVQSASAQGEFSGTEVGRCLEGVVESMRFPETREESRTIRFPFSVR